MKIAALIFASLLAVAVASAQTETTTTTTKTEKSGKNEPAEKVVEKTTEKTVVEKVAEKTPEKPAEKATTEGEKKAAAAAKKTETKTPLSVDVKTLVVEDLTSGKGKSAQKGKAVKVHYTGWLYDPTQPNGKGKQFDSSVKRGEAFIFPLGAGQVIKGWDEGFKDMKVGGKRKLVVPSDMAYGRTGAGNTIPPNATLLFEVELLDVMDSTSGTKL